MIDGSEILAGGAVIWRRSTDGEIEIVLVHRPKYGDWSIPKGKCETGEELVSCAYRESLEETGFDIRLESALGNISYDYNGLQKRVFYWSAKCIREISKPNPDEVDEVRWVSIGLARQMLSKVGELQILDRFTELDLDSKVLVLLRHAKAVAREDWNSEDLDRPLDSQGILQAKRLISTLTPFGIEEIHSSSAVRGYETINPLAKALGKSYFFADELSDYIYKRDRERTFKYLKRVLENDSVTLLCSHNPILPDFVAMKLTKQGFEVEQSKLDPGDAWIIHHVGSEIQKVDLLKAPKVI